MHTLPMLRDVLRIDLLLKLLLATLLGGVIGWERETSGKPAGLRTNILICVGAALFTYLSNEMSRFAYPGGELFDPARIAAQILPGIGFIGAGTIMQSRGNITGLTTAATLWVVAAIGMASGSGAFIEATGSTLLVLLVLWPLGWVEDRIETSRQGRILRVVFEDEAVKVEEIQETLEQHDLRVRLESVAKAREGESQAVFDVRGNSNAFRAARGEVLELPGVRGAFRS